MIDLWLGSTAYTIRAVVTGSNAFHERLTGSVTGTDFLCHIKFSQKQILDIEGNSVITKAQLLTDYDVDIQYDDMVYVDDYDPMQVKGLDTDSSRLSKVVFLK